MKLITLIAVFSLAWSMVTAPSPPEHRRELSNDATLNPNPTADGYDNGDNDSDSFDTPEEDALKRIAELTDSEDEMEASDVEESFSFESVAPIADKFVHASSMMKKEHISVVEAYLLNNKQLVNYRDEKSRDTLLMCAVRSENYSLVLMLLKIGVDVRLVDKNADALLWSAAHAQPKIFKLLWPSYPLNSILKFREALSSLNPPFVLNESIDEFIKVQLSIQLMSLPKGKVAFLKSAFNNAWGSYMVERKQ